MASVSRTTAKRSKWALDFSSKSKGERATDVPSPPGYCSSSPQTNSEIAKDGDNKLIVKKSWDVALGPLKQVPMNLFIMYMAGNSISIFPIMMVGMLFLRPVKALLAIQNTFRMIEGNQNIAQKFVYLVGNVACLALALYKCQSMGLLPTHASDWLEFVEAQQRIEFSGGGLLLFKETCGKALMALTKIKRSKWALDFSAKSKHERNDVAAPPGYSFSANQSNTEFANDGAEDNKLIVKQSWNIALGPLKQLPMNLFIMYMSGNSISIFPIMMLGMMLFRPMKALFDVQTTFNMMKGDQMAVQKLVYFVSNLMCLGLALYKCHTMSLLPIFPSDWLEFKEPLQRVEFSGGGILL